MPQVRLTTATLTLAALVLALVAAGAVRLLAPDEAVRGLPGNAQVRTYAPATGASTAAVVSYADIAAAGRGTPGQSLLAWWQALQLDAPLAEVQAAFAPQAGVDRKDLARQLKRVRYLFLDGRPTLVDERIDGDTATLVTLLGRAGAEARPRSFRMVRVGGAWKLADNRFLKERSRAELRFAAEQALGR